MKTPQTVSPSAGSAECRKCRTWQPASSIAYDLRFERDRLRAALETLRDMMGPKGREAFVAQGPRMFGAVLRVVETALR